MIMILYTKKDKKIIVGSNVFFSEYSDFVPHDKDELILVASNKNQQIYTQIRLNGNCKFIWKRMTPKEYIDYHKQHQVGIYLGKFLVPDFVKEIGFTIDDMKELEFLIDNLDNKHQYEKIIYNAYIENNDFYLTDDQRLQAYEMYKRYKNSEINIKIKNKFKI